ncbi:MAG: CoA-transferase subunit beta [Actinobacteria bacterium]|nr:CoA-transferase subunit beta [Actinomycetota bacterium]
MSANPAEYSVNEMMIAASARQLEGERVCFVGIGPPNIACNLARRTVTPALELVYEAGVYGADPQRLPLSIGDPTLVTGAVSVTSMFEIFSFYLQRGLIDVAFLGASQIDRFGNINTTVVGGYDKPKVRLPGSGGACEISINANRVFVIMPQTRRSFVEEVDFVTSPGHLAGKRPAEWLGGGPYVVVTGLGVYRFGDDGVMYLSRMHPGVTVEQVQANTGWDMRVSPDLVATDPPSELELNLMRNELDPEGVYTR